MHGILVLEAVQGGIGVGKYLGAARVVGKRHAGNYNKGSVPIRSEGRKWS